MKTAGEWASDFFQENGLPIATPERIRSIQLDALREAAEIARIAAHRLGGYQFTHDAILARIKEVEG